MMQRDSRIFVAGHRGLVGSAMMRKLKKENHSQILIKTRSELNLLDQASVQRYFNENSIEFVFLAAAKVGGIHFNSTQPADFLYENLVIATNVIHAAAQSGVKKLLFLGSSCIYPRLAPQPIREEYLLTSSLEPTNEAYAIAKIAGLKLCEMYQKQYKKNFISAMPTNLYGPNDNFHPMNSHVIPSLLRRFHEAKASQAPIVTLWGTGIPKREFLHVDDLADALYLLMQKYNEPTTINVGSDEEFTIRELGNLVQKTVQYTGDIVFEPSMPDGTPRKKLDISRVQNLGWFPKIKLSEGLKQTYQWALENKVF